MRGDMTPTGRFDRSLLALSRRAAATTSNFILNALTVLLSLYFLFRYQEAIYLLSRVCENYFFLLIFLVLSEKIKDRTKISVKTETFTRIFNYYCRLARYLT